MLGVSAHDVNRLQTPIILDVSVKKSDMELTKMKRGFFDGERLSHELVTAAMDFGGPDRFAVLNLGESSIMRGGTELLQPPSLAPGITRYPADAIDVTAGERVPGMISPFNASAGGVLHINACI
jgi:hypothetical protein